MKKIDPQLRLIAALACKIRKEFVDAGQDDSLACMCACATSKLFEECVKRNIDVKICYNHNHVFLTYKRYVIDLSAQQFDHRLMAVEIRSISEMRKIETLFRPTYGKTYWDTLKRFTSVEDLRKHLKNEKWPHWQIPPEDGRLFHEVENI